MQLLASYDIGKSGGNLIKKRSKEAAPTYKPFLAGVWNENARKNRTGCISSDVSFWVKNIKHGAIWAFLRFFGILSLQSKRKGDMTVKKLISLCLAALLCLSILAGLSQTVCYAGEANDPTTSSSSPTEPTERENPTYPDELPKHKDETT